MKHPHVIEPEHSSWPQYSSEASFVMSTGKQRRSRRATVTVTDVDDDPQRAAFIEKVLERYRGGKRK
jgi:hypothetical protein